MTSTTIVLAVTTFATALVTGLFYAYSCSVNPGLHQLSDREYLTAMQSINRAILNPVFFASFIGTLFLLPFSSWMHYSKTLSPEFILLLIASLLYAIGVFGVTIAYNVPLNEMLDKIQLTSATAKEITAHRSIFEGRWNFFHQIRTLACIGSLLLTIVSCLYRDN